VTPWRRGSHSIPPRGAGARGWIIPSMKAVTTSAITAASGTGSNTPGSGTVTVRRYNGSTVATAESLTVLNDFKTSIPINYRVRIEFDEGEWWIASQDCTVGP
jgi:hypothetical protein